MKFPFSFAVAWLGLALLAPAATATKSSITEVDAAAGAFTITDGHGGFKVYRTKPTTEIMLNNQKAQLADLHPGLSATVTGGDPGIAERVVATGPSALRPGVAKTAPTQSQVRVPATAVHAKPYVLGNVVAGQTVAITPIKVWWTGGGSKAGVYCDWRGYPGSKIDGKPWMALVAEVGSSAHVAEGSNLTFTVPADGTLILYVNDDKPEGNVGFGDVTVTVGKASGSEK